LAAVQKRFQDQTAIFVEQLQNKINSDIATVDSFVEKLRREDKIDFVAFRDFGRDVVSNKVIYWMGWAPYVEREDRPAVEQDSPHNYESGQRFHFLEVDHTSNTWIQAGEREKYLPIYYLPKIGEILGFDLLTFQPFFNDLKDLQGSNKTTKFIKVFQIPISKELSYWTIYPIFGEGSFGGSTRNSKEFQGCLLAATYPQEMMNRLTEDLKYRELNFKGYDSTDPQHVFEIYSSPELSQALSESFLGEMNKKNIHFTASHIVQFQDRRLRLDFVVNYLYLSNYKSWTPLLVAGSIFMCNLIFAFFTKWYIDRKFFAIR
jgi:hypothetical protein